jgi:hypothetical protein
MDSADSHLQLAQAELLRVADRVQALRNTVTELEAQRREAQELQEAAGQMRRTAATMEEQAQRSDYLRLKALEEQDGLSQEVQQARERLEEQRQVIW